jgi:ribosomal protein L11 methyltransferase
MSDALLDARLLELVTDSLDRLTPLELKRQVRQMYPSLEHGRIASALKRLVEQKELMYTYQFGNSFLEPSFEKPVRVTDAIVLKPPACAYDPQWGDVVINIKAGAAFGTGCHPTTRLSLRGLEKVCRDDLSEVGKQDKRVLDIGTGSGILAIAALKLGFGRGIGLDIDPCARAEASANAALNGLSNQMLISDQTLNSLEGNFFLVIANLRMPTLLDYFDKMSALMEKEGYLIISGIKSNEIKTLIRIAKLHGMQVCWEGRELGWGGLVLH